MLITINFTPNPDNLCYINVPVYPGITVAEVRDILQEQLAKFELKGSGDLRRTLEDVPYVLDQAAYAIEDLWSNVPEDSEVLEEEAYRGSNVAFHFHGM